MNFVMTHTANEIFDVAEMVCEDVQAYVKSAKILHWH